MSLPHTFFRYLSSSRPRPREERPPRPSYRPLPPLLPRPPPRLPPRLPPLLLLSRPLPPRLLLPGRLCLPPLENEELSSLSLEADAAIASEDIRGGFSAESFFLSPPSPPKPLSEVFPPRDITTPPFGSRSAVVLPLNDGSFSIRYSTGPEAVSTICVSREVATEGARPLPSL